MKTCTCCKQLLSLDNFHKKNARGKPGYVAICKSCKAIKDKAYRDSKKEELHAKAVKRFADNKEKYRANRIKRYHEATPEEVEKRKAKKREAQKNISDESKARKKAYDKVYFSSEIGKLVTRKSTHKRRNQAKILTGTPVTLTDLMALKEKQLHKCKYCDNPLQYDVPRAVHLDHIIPLSKGGTHCMENVVWACASCNLRKSDKLIDA